MGFSAIHWLIVLVPSIVLAVVVVRWMRRSQRDDLLAPPGIKRQGLAAPEPPAATDLPEDVAEEVRAALRIGRVVTAVKLVREATGLDLRHAKAVVDDMRRRDPELR